jgi:hypothetical protein
MWSVRIRVGTYFRQILRYEERFERQYDRAYRGWSNYQERVVRAHSRDLDRIIKETSPRLSPTTRRTLPLPIRPHPRRRPRRIPLHNVASGMATAYSLAVVPFNGFSGTVLLSPGSLPPGGVGVVFELDDRPGADRRGDRSNRTQPADRRQCVICHRIESRHEHFAYRID